jgi:hypothetical protein
MNENDDERDDNEDKNQDEQGEAYARNEDPETSH